MTGDIITVGILGQTGLMITVGIEPASGTPIPTGPIPRPSPFRSHAERVGPDPRKSTAEV